MDRTAFLRSAAVALAAVALHGCGANGAGPASRSGATRFTARPRRPDNLLPAGRHDLMAATATAGQLFIPESAHDRARPPLLVMLHGAGPSRTIMHRIFPVAEDNGAIVVTPLSAGRTWDLILGDAGVDVDALDRVLGHVFQQCNVDPARIALAGFSDGGTYALSLGLRNGDLFTHVGAFAPGFMLAEPRVGRPRIFISHGDADTILPCETTSAPIRRQLQGWGYDVVYQSFSGGHGLNLAHVDDCLKWLAS